MRRNERNEITVRRSEQRWTCRYRDLSQSDFSLLEKFLKKHVCVHVAAWTCRPLVGSSVSSPKPQGVSPKLWPPKVGNKGSRVTGLVLWIEGNQVVHCSFEKTPHENVAIPWMQRITVYEKNYLHQWQEEGRKSPNTLVISKFLSNYSRSDKTLFIPYWVITLLQLTCSEWICNYFWSGR